MAVARKARPGELNYAPMDRYTLAHGAFGMLLAAARVPRGWAFAIAVTWEFAERPLKDRFPRMFPSGTQDSVLNATFDSAAMMTGYGLFKSIERRAIS